MTLDIKVARSGTVPRSRREDERGILSVFEAKDMPFPMARVYIISDVPSGTARGAHAHHETDQVLFVIRGRVTLDLDDGIHAQSLTVSEVDEGIRLAPMLWHSMRDFSVGTVVLMVASLPYDEADYIRDYDSFKRYASTL